VFSSYSKRGDRRRGRQEGSISVAVLWWHCAGDYASCDVVRGVWERPGADRESMTNPPCDVRPARDIREIAS